MAEDQPVITPGKLFIGGLSWVTTQDGLKNYFEKFGVVTDAILMRDKITQRSRGFGFVTFEDGKTAEKVVASQHTLDGRQIDAKFAQTQDEIRKEGNKVKKVFVGGLPLDLEQEDFRAYFEQFGEITECIIMRDRESDHSRGFGFITFAETEAVDKVLRVDHEINGKQVELKKAVPRQPPSASHMPYFAAPRHHMHNAHPHPPPPHAHHSLHLPHPAAYPVAYAPPPYASPYGYPEVAYGPPSRDPYARGYGYNPGDRSRGYGRGGYGGGGGDGRYRGGGRYNYDDGYGYYDDYYYGGPPPGLAPGYHRRGDTPPHQYGSSRAYQQYQQHRPASVSSSTSASSSSRRVSRDPREVREHRRSSPSGSPDSPGAKSTRDRYHPY